MEGSTRARSAMSSAVHREQSERKSEGVKERRIRANQIMNAAIKTITRAADRLIIDSSEHNLVDVDSYLLSKMVPLRPFINRKGSSYHLESLHIIKK